MKATGIIRRVDELGRVVIPIEIYVDNSSIILKKFEPNCIFCGSTENLVEYKGKLVCDKCSKGLNDLQDKDKNKNK